MPWIVVLESDGRLAEKIREGLVGDGWQVEVTASRDAAADAVGRLSPQLVVADLDTDGASDLLAANSRNSGGPGAIAVVGKGQEAAGADESIERSIAANDLRLLVRRLVTEGRATRATMPEGDGERLTSQELFGDLLAEVEAEHAAQKAPPAPKPAASPELGLDARLSGLLQEPAKSRPAPARRADPDVDALLSKTLSGLEVGDRVKSPAAGRTSTPKPKRVEPAPPPEPAPAPPIAAAERPAPERAAPEKEKPAAPDVDQLIEGVKPAAAPPPVRRPARRVDLSSLDDLVKSRPSVTREKREATPPPIDPRATQKVVLPTAVRPSSGPIEFGQYTLLERIALGGMAEVWKARMKGVEGFQKTVAIKKILPHLTDSTDFVTMFIDEAKLAAQLNHNNIIHIYDLGKIGDDYYIAMEFVEGKDLRSILNAARAQDRPLPLGLALLVASRLAGALDHAHHKKDFEGRELGLVHRDVSPQNVLISFDGDIKLCDFGIVKAVSKASKTQMGALKGKLQYMSPEQAWGRPVDARSDIFSLGSLLFEMITGRRLFTGESEMSVLDAVREGRIQAPRDLDPRVPLEVNALVLHALAREPKDRFASAGEFQRQIDGILDSLKPAPAQRELAAYVRELFEAEPRTEATPAAATLEPAVAAAPSSPAVPAAVAARTGAAAAALEPRQTGTAAGDKALDSATGGRSLLWIGLAAAVVLAVVGVYVFRGSAAPAPAPQLPAAAAESATPEGGGAAAVPAPQPAPTDGATASGESAAGETKAEPGKNVSDLVESEVKKHEEQLRQKLDAELEKKKQELAAAQEKNATAPPPVTAAPAPTPKPEPKPQKAQESPAATAKQAPAAAPETSVETAKPEAGATPSAAEPAPATTKPVTSPPVPAPAPAPAATRKAPSVREGDLVQPGPGVTPPVLVSYDKPAYPPIARRMRVEGTVVLSLLVDENGRVIDVRLENGVSQNVGINEAAVAAAKSARFQPATKDGVRVKTWHQLTIPFKL